jgi:glycosidase
LATAPGIPVIYYGMEQGFNGACPSVSRDVGDAHREIEQVCNDGASHERYRQDMFLKGPWRLGSTVPEVQALARVGRVSDETAPTWEKDPYLSRDHEVYQTARRMMRLRSSCSPLSRGQTVYRWGEFNREGIFAFSRIDAGREMVVVVNTSPSRLAIPGELELDGTLNQRAGEVYESVLPDGSKGIVRLRDGRAFISFDGQTLDGNSVTVFAHRNNLQPLDAALGVRLCRP